MNRTRALRLLATVSAVLAYLQATLGGIVRVSGSGEGCQGWPLCSGQPYPASNVHSFIEFSHRTNGALLGLAVVATFALVLWRFRAQRRLVALATAALLLVVFEGAVGGTVVLAELAAALVLFHFGMALVILGVLLALVLETADRGGEVADAGHRRLLDVTATLTFLLLLTGSGVTATSAEDRCLAWPLCGNGFGVDLGGVTALNYLHRGAVLLIGLLVLRVSLTAWRRWSAVPGMRLAAGASALLLVLQAADGAALALTGNFGIFSAAHVALATATWSAVVAMTLLARANDAPAAARSRFELQGHPT